MKLSLVLAAFLLLIILANIAAIQVLQIDKMDAVGTAQATRDLHERLVDLQRFEKNEQRRTDRQIIIDYLSGNTSSAQYAALPIEYRHDLSVH